MKQTLANKNINVVNNKQSFIKQIKASYFRNYKNLELNLTSENIVLFGSNGVGKTNILEAVSFLSSGRGIRKARAKELVYRKFDNKSLEDTYWGINASVFVSNKTFKIGTGIRKKNNSRLVKINDKFHSRKILPISLSYDHRIIDGAEGARFCVYLGKCLGKDFAFKLAV